MGAFTLIRETEMGAFGLCLTFLPPRNMCTSAAGETTATARGAMAAGGAKAAAKLHSRRHTHVSAGALLRWMSVVGGVAERCGGGDERSGREVARTLTPPPRLGQAAARACAHPRKARIKGDIARILGSSNFNRPPFHWGADASLAQALFLKKNTRSRSILLNKSTTTMSFLLVLLSPIRLFSEQLDSLGWRVGGGAGNCTLCEEAKTSSFSFNPSETNINRQYPCGCERDSFENTSSAHVCL